MKDTILIPREAFEQTPVGEENPKESGEYKVDNYPDMFPRAFYCSNKKEWWNSVNKIYRVYPQFWYKPLGVTVKDIQEEAWLECCKFISHNAVCKDGSEKDFSDFHNEWTKRQNL